MALWLSVRNLLRNNEIVVHPVEMIKSMHKGITIAIDDFGTGYSSLAYLTRYAIDYLKIDKSFVIQMDKSENSKVVKTIIDLGSSLGLGVVAEGVETAEQFALLDDHGCNYFQGYHMAQPLSSDRLIEYISRQIRTAE